MDINHRQEKAEQVFTHYKASDKKKPKFMSLLEKQRLGLDDGPTIVTKRAPKAERKPAQPVPQVEVNSQPVQSSVVESQPQVVEPQQVETTSNQPGSITHNVQPQALSEKKSTADKTTVYHNNPEEPFVMHQRRPQKTTYTTPEKPNVDKADPQDHILTHGKVVTAEPVQPEPQTTVGEQPVQTPVQKPTTVQVQEPVPAPKPAGKSLEDLKEMFGKDINKIITTVLSKSLNFEEYKFEIKLQKIDIIEGAEGVAKATADHPFTLRVPNPKAVSFLLDTLLGEAYKMGFDRIKLTDMLIEMMEMSKDVTEWLMMLNELWGELKANARG